MIRTELHSHTIYSRDCRMKLRDIIRACERKQIGCLAVTDHNEFAGAARLKEIAPFDVILAEEITSSEGEIIGYFLKERIQPGLSPEETIRRIRSQGGLVSVPHPFDRLRGSRLAPEAFNRIFSQIDFMEIFNARNVFSADDAAAKAFSDEHKIPGLAVSDAHTPYELGRSSMMLPARVTRDTFLDAMQQAERVTRRSPLWVHAVTKINKFKSKLAAR